MINKCRGLFNRLYHYSKNYYFFCFSWLKQIGIESFQVEILDKQRRLNIVKKPIKKIMKPEIKRRG